MAYSVALKQFIIDSLTPLETGHANPTVLADYVLMLLGPKMATSEAAEAKFEEQIHPFLGIDTGVFTGNLFAFLRAYSGNGQSAAGGDRPTLHNVVLRMPKSERNMVAMERTASRVCAEAQALQGCQECHVGVDDQSETARNDDMMTWVVSSTWASRREAETWLKKGIWEKLGISGFQVLADQSFTIRASVAEAETLSDSLASVRL